MSAQWTLCAAALTIGRMWRETDVGKFYDLIQQHVDDQAYPPSERELAKRLKVTPSTLANWRHPKKLIEKDHIEAVAELAGVSYTRALDALLEDIGYKTGRNNGSRSA